MIAYNVRINNVRDLELFANFVKDALCYRLTSEKFSMIRLQGARLCYEDFMHKVSLRGETNGLDDTMTVTQKDSALQLAGTIVHEMAHVLVGTPQQHNTNWVSAANHLGLQWVEEKGQAYAPEHFDKHALAVIEEALARFAREYPKLVYDPEIEIPLPEWIGHYNCPLREDGNGCSKHRLHTMQFQEDGVREMLSRSGNILLADEMGLGKTPEVIMFMNATRPKRVLVGCPNNTKLIWKRHFEEWCIDPDIAVAYSQLYMFDERVIMNYEALAKWGNALQKQEWDLVIYDEGHYLKTPNAKRSKAAYSIHGAKSIIITGTPIVNYPYELFPLIHYLDRDNWPEYGRFENQFGSRSSERLGRNLNRLNSMLRATIMTRRFKKDVMTELPKKRRQIVEFEVPLEVKKLIEEEKKLFATFQGNGDSESMRLLNIMKNESDVTGDDLDWAAIIEELKYTKKFAFEEMARIAHLIGRAKLPLVIEHVENALEAREKVVVFGHHRDVLTTIHERFNGSVLLLGGNTNQALATEEATKRFNEKDDCCVFVAQMSNAQGYSIKGSSTVIFCEEDWVPGVMQQAEDRAHGIGRGDIEARSMLIQHLVFEDSLDTYKAKLTIKKLKSIERATGSLK